MQVKKYRAHNLPEAMKLIRAELGPDALIIHSQKVSQKNLLGWAQQPILEVTAAVDKDLRDFPQPTAAMTEAIQQLQNELAALKLATGQAAQAQRQPDLPLSLDDWYRRLQQQGIASTLAWQIIRTLADELNLWALDNPNTVGQHVHSQLKRRLPLASLSFASGQPDVLFLIGPTGVGKTSTIAKLAAALAHSPARQPSSKEGVLIITVDTFRLGALSQIVTFAEILGVPLVTAYTPEQLAASVAVHRQHHFILVDTPGRSQRDTAALAELGGYLSAVPDKLVHLTLSAGTQYETMRQTVESFRPLSIDGLIFTKLDETASLGPAYTLACETGLPLSYFTTGQRIPEDIEAATADRLVNFMLGPLPTQVSPASNDLMGADFSQSQTRRNSYGLPS
ncbi:MAG: hypothetical protein KJ077_03210 [Anaerolineae bacterium]|nr:hypothetical protein [Anaerolineae bacterium]